MKDKIWGVYVHIPFCRQKCYYCDFPSYAGRERYMADYIAALCQEIQVRGSFYKQKWNNPATVYIGGGTPTALPYDLMAKLLQKLQENLTAKYEFTVECNPGTVDSKYLALLYANGVNRLSLGVQSFNDEILRSIGRIHTGSEAGKAILMAKKIGFANINLDLMYGLPGQSLQDLKNSVVKAIDLKPEHISIYGLQLEEGTVFFKQQAAGKLILPTDAETEAMYDYMTSFLPKSGYLRYEISNFAKKGYESRHNMGYWQDVPYLGLGAAAHSYLAGQRYAASKDIARYIAGVRTGEFALVKEEETNRKTSMEEFCFLALRTAQGIDKKRFAQKFNCSIQSVYADVIAKMKAKELLYENETSLALTELGMEYGNLVFSEFIL